MAEQRWKGGATSGWMEEPGGEISLSISGYERNRLFLGAGGSQFRDLSGVSGLDALADGRAFALTDYDRDGWQDVAAVNTNAPLLQLFRNDIAARGGTGNAIALRFSGGNHSPGASGDFGPRDGYGAMVTVSLGETKLLREYRCGEGLAAQNSATMLVGIGRRGAADAVEVRWPGGTVQRTGPVAAGTLLTVFENPAHSPTGEAFVPEPYRRPSPAPQAGRPQEEGAGEFSLPSPAASSGTRSRTADVHLHRHLVPFLQGEPAATAGAAGCLHPPGAGDDRGSRRSRRGGGEARRLRREVPAGLPPAHRPERGAGRLVQRDPGADRRPRSPAFDPGHRRGRNASCWGSPACRQSRRSGACCAAAAPGGDRPAGERSRPGNRLPQVGPARATDRQKTASNRLDNRTSPAGAGERTDC